MYAMRLARAFTGREKIVKFEGGYHGMSRRGADEPRADPQVNFPRPCPTAPASRLRARRMLIAPFNDAAVATSLMAEHADEIAAIIVEPLQRIIPPEPGFLQALRAACDKHGMLLIFDEIVTGFRFAYGGAQERYGVTPDICTLGKIIGGGFPARRHRRARRDHGPFRQDRRRTEQVADATRHAFGQSRRRRGGPEDAGSGDKSAWPSFA
jgi:glutamate-1-semialdehyde 2,1-aminomutase